MGSHTLGVQRHLDLDPRLTLSRSKVKVEFRRCDLNGIRMTMLAPNTFGLLVMYLAPLSYKSQSKNSTLTFDPLRVKVKVKFLSRWITLVGPYYDLLEFLLYLSPFSRNPQRYGHTYIQTYIHTDIQTGL